MTKKLTRHGNSRALVIEKPILDLLGIDDNTTLQVYTDGESLIITPENDNNRTAKIQNIGSKYANKFPRAMQVLGGKE